MVGEIFDTRNLQGLWHFNGNLTDSSPNGYTLTNNGSTDVVAKFGNGRNFVSASSQYATIADASCPNLELSGSQTWVAWVKLATLADFHCVMAKTNTVNSTDHRLLVDSTGAVLFQLTGLSTNIQVTSTNRVTAGIWACLTAVYDSSEQRLKVWVDGTKTEVVASGSANDSNGDFSVGRLGSAGSFYFNGVIDEVAIYSRAWSDSEVRSYFTWSRGYYTKVS